MQTYQTAFLSAF